MKIVERIAEEINSVRSEALTQKNRIDNPHSVTKSQIGLSDADNTADNIKNVLSATKLTTARLINGVSFDGTTNINILFSGLDSIPNTVDGYGITDVYTKSQTDSNITVAISNLIDSSPEALDTLNELAAALGDDPNFATTVSNQIGTKVDKIVGKQLSTEDYTTVDKYKLVGIDVLLGTNNNTRYDKILASLDIIEMIYIGSDLTTVRYTGDNGTDTFFRDVLSYISGDLVEVKHYYNKANLLVASGTTTLSYVAGNLASTTYTE